VPRSRPRVQLGRVGGQFDGKINRFGIGTDREVEGRVSRDAFLAADDFAHCLFGPAGHFGERSLGQASCIELLPKDIARDCQDNRYAREFLRFHQW
jgi:hypothetical protein